MQVVVDVAVDDEAVVHVGAAVGAYVVVGAAAVVAVDVGACAVVTVVDDGGEVVVDGSSAPCSCLCAFLTFDRLSFHALFLDHGPF